MHATLNLFGVVKNHTKP